MTNLVSIVITSYNRYPLVNQAIHSALKFTSKIGGKVILVDDASIDNSYERINTKFYSAIKNGKLIVLRNKINLGVTASKNRGFLKAKSKWVGFLDSDDLILNDSIPLIKNILLDYFDKPLIFMKCVDQNGRLVGAKFDQIQEIDIKRFLTYTTYGEVFGFFNKEIIKFKPYDEDLRGYEGIGCARIIKKYGSALLLPHVIRCYNQFSPNRLSNKIFTDRAKFIALGHKRILEEFDEELNLKQKLVFLLKVFMYRILSFLYEKKQ
jgi:glycosyltransferase involved in cell wall biosynthesis